MKHTSLKKLLALLLALTMCFSLLPVQAFADDGDGEFLAEEELAETLPEMTVEDEEGEDLSADEIPCEHVPAEAVSENAVAPTCTESGSHDEVVYCSVCGEELSRETVEDPALGHLPRVVEAVASTCAESGHTVGMVCGLCREVLEGCEPLPLAEHKPEDVEAVASTCAESGHTAGVVCAVCGETLEGCEPLPLAEHTPEDTGELPAEPGKAGHTAGVVCAVCGMVLEGCEEIPALTEGETEANDELSAQEDRAAGTAINPTNFPDPAFQSYVTRFDTNKDNKLSTEEAEAVTRMDLESLGIKTLVGIALFTNLKELACGGNQLTSLNLSGFESLSFLLCSRNQLETLVLSGCVNLKELYCDHNRLSVLDLSDCKDTLERLVCSNCQLTQLNLNDCEELYLLSCEGNQLKHLDLSSCPFLMGLLGSGRVSQGIYYSDRNSEDEPWYRSLSYDAGITINTSYPIIIIPGVMGSRLLSTSGEEIWPSASLLEILNIGEIIRRIYHQLTINRQIMVPGHENHGLFLETVGTHEYGTLDTSKNLIEYLLERFPNKEVYFFSYDWRQSNADSARELEAGMEKLGITKASFVCHSMGGLVISHFVQQGHEDVIDRAIILGTPYEGAPLLLQSVLTKKSLDGGLKQAIFNIVALFRGMDVNQKREYPGVAELSPTLYYQVSSAEKISLCRELLCESMTVYTTVPKTSSLVNLKIWAAIPSGDRDVQTAKDKIKEYIKQQEGLYGAWLSGVEIIYPREGVTELSLVYLNAESYNSPDEIDLFLAEEVVSDMQDLAKDGYLQLLSMPNVYFAIGDSNKTLSGTKVLIKQSQVSSNNRFELLDITEAAGDGTVPIASSTMGGNITSRVRYFSNNHLGLAGSGSGKEIKDWWQVKNWIAYALGNSTSTENIGRTSISNSAKNAYKKIKIACPVIASVSYGGETLTSDPENYCEETSFGRMYTLGEDGEGGESVIFILDWDVDYDILMTGTDEGLMDFELLTCDENDNVLETLQALDVPVTGEGAEIIVANEAGATVLSVQDGGNTQKFIVAPIEGLGEPLHFDREYLALKVDDTVEDLTLTAEYAELLSGVKWSAVDSDNVLLGEDPVLTIDEQTHQIKALKPGTAYVVAYVAVNDRVYYARCRVDVVANETESGIEIDTPIADEVRVNGVRLPVTSAAFELYRSDCSVEIPVELILSQNLDRIGANDGGDELLASGKADNGMAITGAEFINTDLDNIFEMYVKDDRTLVIIPKREYVTTDAVKLKNLKSSYKSALRIFVEDEAFETDAKQQLAITIKKTQPKLKATNVKLNSFVLGDTQPLNITGGTVTGIYPDPGQDAWVQSDGEAPVYQDWVSLVGFDLVYMGGLDVKKPSAKLNLRVTVDGWALDWPVQVSVSAAPTAPKLSVKPSSLSLQPGTNDIAVTMATVTPATFSYPENWPITVESIVESKTVFDISEENYNAPVLVDFDGHTIRVSENKNISPDDLSKPHTYKVTLAIKRGEDITVKTVLTVKLLKEKTASLSVKAAGTIDTGIRQSPITLTVSLKNFHASSVSRYELGFSRQSNEYKFTEYLTESVPFRTVQNGEVFTVTQAGELEPGWTYYANLSAEIADGEWIDAKPVKLNVKITDPAKSPKPGVTLKAAGCIDVIRPGSAVTVTPMVKNCYTYEPDARDLQIVKADGTDAVNLFDINMANGVFVIKQKPGVGINHTADKFQVSLKAERCGLETVKPTVLPVKMGSAKIVQSTKTVTLLKDDRYDRAVITITPETDLSQIKDVQMLPLKDKNGHELFELIPLGGGEYAIGYGKETNPNSPRFGEPVLPAAGYKGGTLKLQVFLIGNNSTKPNATISVSVKLV